MSSPRYVNLPGICVICGNRVASAVFVGDLDTAVVAERPCKNCDGKIYRSDEDNDRDITDSAWDSDDGEGWKNR